MAIISSKNPVSELLIQDEHPIINLDMTNREFDGPTGYVVAMAGDNYSQELVFSTPREYDGIDLYGTFCILTYWTSWVDDEQKHSKGFVILNGAEKENNLEFKWTLNLAQTAKPGKCNYTLTFYLPLDEDFYYQYDLENNNLSFQKIDGVWYASIEEDNGEITPIPNYNYYSLSSKNGNFNIIDTGIGEGQAYIADDSLVNTITGFIDQNYDSESTNAQSGKAVALAISSKADTLYVVEALESKANKSEVPIVEQEFNSNSENAQSGKAVNQAILDAIINTVFHIESSVFDYSYLNYLKWDEPHTLKKGGIYKAIDACEYDGVFYPANTLYQWTGEDWKELDIIKYLRDQIPIKTSELEKDDVYTKDECNEYFSPTKNTISEFVIYLADNSEYYGTNISALDIEYPQGDFECWLRLTFANEGEITVRLPESQYIGSAPTFSNGETWEISIKDGVVIAQKVGA